MTASQRDLTTVRQLILGSLRVAKFAFSFIWFVLLTGITTSTISTWLTSKKLDLLGTPLGWITQNLPLVIPYGFCLLLLTAFAWIVSSVLERDTSWLYSAEEKERIKLRRRFAMTIEHEIEQVSMQEDWKDYRFTELEAEVEAQGRQKRGTLNLNLFRQSNNRLRREKSLSKALKKSDEKIILVEGEPGSGKSVALRHVALEMAAKAKKASNAKCVLPIYVNMKLLERESEEKINRNLIESFIVKSLMRGNNRDMRRFLDNELQKGIEDGTILFLFDSFDEIPEILNSVEADDMVNDYGNAIDDFLHGMNQCHGVIASRFYHGPTRKAWTRFRILPLNEVRQFELIKQTDIASKAKWIVGQLGNTNLTIRSMASNPFFLALLCKYLEKRNLFPENVHGVYETFIDQRFKEDEKDLEKTFQIDIDKVRAAAEVVAFCMTASPSLGLNPTRTDLQDALLRLGIVISDSLENLLDALEYMKIARPDTAANTTSSKSFTFSHRRFQEYFATCFVLREPDYVKPEQLLTQGSWRETAVVLCQTQKIELLISLTREIERLLAGFCAEIPDLINNPVEYIANISKQIDTDHRLALSRFPWPTGLFHLLSLLQDGFAGRLTELPITINMHIDKLLLSAIEGRMRGDNKLALEVAGTASKPVLEYLLNKAFSSKSQWVKEVAFRQVARLNTIPPTIAKGIRYALLRLCISGRLQQEKQATEAHLKRLNQASDFLSIMRLLLVFPAFDMISLFLVSYYSFIFLLFYEPFAISDLIIICPLSFLFASIIRNRYKSFIVFLYKVDYYDISWMINLMLYSIPFSLILTLYISPMITITKRVQIYNNHLIIYYIFSIALTYLWLFIPFAIIAIATGNYFKMRWWILMSLWPSIYFIEHINKIFKSLKVEILNLNVKSILINILGALFLISFIIFVAFIFSTINLPSSLLIILAIFFTLLLILITSINDMISTFYYFKWRLNFKGSITSKELCDFLEQPHFRRNECIKVLNYVLEKRALVMSQETLKFLETVTYDIEKRQENDQRKQHKRKMSKEKYNRLNITLKSLKLRRAIKRLKLNKKHLSGDKLLILYANDRILDEFYYLIDSKRFENS